MILGDLTYENKHHIVVETERLKYEFGYTKVKLLTLYSTGKIREAILSVMPEEIRNLAIEK